MDLGAEKAAIIKRFEQVHDLKLIKAIKDLLDFGLSKQINDDQALEESINRGMQQSKQGLVRPHSEVMAEVRKRYHK